MLNSFYKDRNVNLMQLKRKTKNPNQQLVQIQHHHQHHHQHQHQQNLLLNKLVLGFCFLIYDEVEREDIWSQYFNDVDPEKYKIFVNSKYPNKLYQSKLFGSKLIPSPVTNTRWGDFSLISAQNALFSEALKNTNITHLILVSHNTIPIKPFKVLYQSLDHNSLFDYGKAIKHEHLRRYYGIERPSFRIDNFFVQSQWCILSRAHAKILVHDYQIIKKIFQKMKIPDEHCYINYLIHYKHAFNIKKLKTTLIYMVKGTPYVFGNVDQRIIQNSGKSFFLRKVSKFSKIDVKL